MTASRGADKNSKNNQGPAAHAPDLAEASCPKSQISDECRRLVHNLQLASHTRSISPAFILRDVKLLLPLPEDGGKSWSLDNTPTPLLPGGEVQLQLTADQFVSTLKALARLRELTLIDRFWNLDFSRKGDEQTQALVAQAGVEFARRLRKLGLLSQAELILDAAEPVIKKFGGAWSLAHLKFQQGKLAEGVCDFAAAVKHFRAFGDAYASLPSRMPKGTLALFEEYVGFLVRDRNLADETRSSAVEYALLQIELLEANSKSCSAIRFDARSRLSLARIKGEAYVALGEMYQEEALEHFGIVKRLALEIAAVDTQVLAALKISEIHGSNGNYTEALSTVELMARVIEANVDGRSRPLDKHNYLQGIVRPIKSLYRAYSELLLRNGRPSDSFQAHERLRELLTYAAQEKSSEGDEAAF